MMLYHGGLIEVAAPDLQHSRKAVDFGPGFYVTPIKEEALRWCAKRKRRDGVAVVSSYSFDESVLSGLKYLRFDTYSEAWLDFVVACRSGNDESDWDLVCGGVANDRVFDTLEAFFDGFASKEQTIDRLKMVEPNVQYCFRTSLALTALKFTGSERV